MLKLATLALVCAALAAAWLLTREESPPPVEIDAVHSRDYARVGCKMAEENWQADGPEISRVGCDAVPGCTANLREKSLCAMGSDSAVMLYINGLSTRFAADKACKGVTVFVTREDSFSNPTKAPLLAKPHSTLLVDFVLDSERQGWGLTAPDAGLMGLGQEGPDGIAATVCNIVGKRGAKIIQ